MQKVNKIKLELDEIKTEEEPKEFDKTAINILEEMKQPLVKSNF